MKNYISKKYLTAQVLWDMFGVACLAAAPLQQQWLFDYGKNSSLAMILCVITLYFALNMFCSLAQYFYVLNSFKSGIYFEKNMKKYFFDSVFNMDSADFYKRTIGDYISIQGNDILALEQDYV